MDPRTVQLLLKCLDLLLAIVPAGLMRWVDDAKAKSQSLQAQLTLANARVLAEKKEKVIDAKYEGEDPRHELDNFLDGSGPR